MKLITLNIWGGHVKEPLLEFVAAHQTCDIFCLQEVYHNAPQKISREDRIVCLDIFSQLQRLLPSHQPHFHPVVGEHYGVAMLIDKKVLVQDVGKVDIYINPHYPGQGPAHSRILQWAKCQSGNRVYSILNVHGLWNGEGKGDAPERILQSQNIKAFMETLQTPKILCGDFNLRPDTESLKILEEGMHNHIRSHGIASTRTSFYPKEEKFADYILTSPEVLVSRFEVLKEEVSDHAPLLMEFV
jgi:endonuclease/exonuclease/phosphatase family metal-dependent hydrolase